MIASLVAWAADPEVDPEVVVVEQPDAPIDTESPASVTVIEIDDRIPESDDLGAVVGRASGVSVQRLGGLGDFTSVSIRGSTARQVTIHLDGIPLNPDGVGGVDLSELPLRAFERVELWRGNAPVGLGGTAMGGSVNLVTPDRGGGATAIAGSAGSWTTARLRGSALRSFESRGGDGLNGDVWLSGAFLSTLGDYPALDDRGTRFQPDDDRTVRRGNNDTRQGVGFARLRVGRDRWRLTLLQTALTREEGVPGVLGNPLEGVRYGAGQSLTVGQLEVSGAVPVMARVHGRFREEDLTDAQGELSGDQALATRSVGADLRAGYAGAPWWRVDAMGSLLRDGFEGDGVPTDAVRTVLRGHAGLSLWAAKRRILVAPTVSVVSLGSRLDAGSGAEPSLERAVLPRLGAMWQVIGPVQLRANAGRYFRPPGPTELFGDRGALQGRSDLRPERGTQLDVGLRITTDRTQLDLGGFWVTSDDLIVYVQNAQRISIPENLGRTSVRGAELAWTTTRSWLETQANATLQQSVSFAEPYVGNELPRTPVFQLDLRAAVVHPELPDLRLGWTFSYTDGIWTDAANVYRQPGRPLNGAFARIPVGRIDHFAPGLVLDLDVQNVLDTRTGRVPANPADPDGGTARVPLADFVGYPLPGRTFLVTLRFEAP